MKGFLPKTDVMVCPVVEAQTLLKLIKGSGLLGMNYIGPYSYIVW